MGSDYLVQTFSDINIMEFFLIAASISRFIWLASTISIWLSSTISRFVWLIASIRLLPAIWLREGDTK